MQSNANTVTGSLRPARKIKVISLMPYIIFVLILILFAIWLGPRFFSVSNILNITRETAMISIMAVAMTFVIASGNIDLSIGSIVAFSSLIVALVLKATNNVLLGVLAGLAVGTTSGLLNGWLIAMFGIPSFLVTLGMQSIVKGSAMWITNTSAVPIMNNLFNQVFGLGVIRGVIPVLLVWTLVAVVVGYWGLSNLGFGKKVLAIGGNVIAAKYTGIRVKLITIEVFLLTGISASVAAMMYAGRMQTARYSFGDGDEMNVIAAVVLGGTSLLGGKGNIIGTLVGSLLIGMITNGLIIGGLSVSQQMIIRGIIIIVAVAFGAIGGRKVMNKN